MGSGAGFAVTLGSGAGFAVTLGSGAGGGGLAASENIFVLAITLGVAEGDEFSSGGPEGSGGIMSWFDTIRGVGTGRGFLGEGGGGSVAGLPGLGASLGPTAGLSSFWAAFARCCCLSHCCFHAGFFSSPSAGEGVRFWSGLLPFGICGCGFAATGGRRAMGGDCEESESSFSCIACISFLLRINSGTSLSFSDSCSVGDFRFTHDGVESASSGTGALLRSWLAQGATCESVSFF